MSKAQFIDRTTPPHILTLVLAAALGAVSMNMFLPSLPSMSVYFATSSAVMQFTVSGYLLATAVLTLFIGPMSDRFGRRPVMLSCLGLFLLGTAICFVSEQFETLLLGRIIQAWSVAGLTLSRAIVRDLVEPDQAASMIGYVTMGMAIGPMIAPTIGGYLDEFFGWRANFIAMAAMGVVALAVIHMNLGETNRYRGSSFAAQVRTYPELFKSRRFWGYTATAAFTSGSFFAFLGGGPFIATDVLKLSPSAFGLYFMFISVGYIAGNFISGKIASQLGINIMMMLGGAAATFGLLMGIALLQMGQLHPAVVFGPVFFVGLGNGMALPSASAGIVSVRPKLAGTASGLGGSLQVGGGALLSAIAGALVAAYGTPSTLLAVMLVSSLLGIGATLYIIQVERGLAADPIT